MSSAGFETAIQAIKRLQIYALDRTATGIGYKCSCLVAYIFYPYTNILHAISTLQGSRKLAM